MKEPEYVLTSDKKNWMDAGVISTIPYKVTVLEARYITSRLEDLLICPAITTLKVDANEIAAMCRLECLSLLQALVSHRCAWKNAYDGDLTGAALEAFNNFGITFEPSVRDRLRYECGIPQDGLTIGVVEKEYPDITVYPWMCRGIREYIDGLAMSLKEHMNPNPYVIHEVRLGKDGRSIRLEEFSDWRVLQWTLQQQAEIDAKREQS